MADDAPNHPPRQLAARLSPVAYDGLSEFCAAQGVSVTAYLDALGQWLHDYAAGVEPATPTAQRVLTRVVEHARAIDAERRSHRDAGKHSS